jgi:hypothetical protein
LKQQVFGYHHESIIQRFLIGNDKHNLGGLPNCFFDKNKNI